MRSEGKIYRYRYSLQGKGNDVTSCCVDGSGGVDVGAISTGVDTDVDVEGGSVDSRSGEEGKGGEEQHFVKVKGEPRESRLGGVGPQGATRGWGFIVTHRI